MREGAVPYTAADQRACAKAEATQNLLGLTPARFRTRSRVARDPAEERLFEMAAWVRRLATAESTPRSLATRTAVIGTASSSQARAMRLARAHGFVTATDLEDTTNPADWSACPSWTAAGTTLASTPAAVPRAARKRRSSTKARQVTPELVRSTCNTMGRKTTFDRKVDWAQPANNERAGRMGAARAPSRER